jgi:hypothetical protein
MRQLSENPGKMPLHLIRRLMRLGRLHLTLCFAHRLKSAAWSGAIPPATPGVMALGAEAAPDGVPVTMDRQHRYGVQFPELPWWRGSAARGWSSAWPERVVGVAGALADLAALVSLGLPGVPGLLQLRVDEAGSRRRVQKARNSRSGSATRRRRSARGSGSAAAAPRSAKRRARGQLIDIGGNPLQDRDHPGQVDHHVRPVGMIAYGTQG